MELRNKKIAVLGLGREGRALFEYFQINSIKADYLDENGAADRSGFPRHTVTGPMAFDHLDRYGMIFRSPGIRPHHPKLKAVQKKLTSLTRLFFDLWPGKIAGVTGTKGKGTTASFIKSIFDHADLLSLLVGNIGFVSLLNLDKYGRNDWAIMELSSFQLMDLGVSPDVAVLLDVTSEHMDYHPNIAEYRAAKLEITSHQTKDDWLIIAKDNAIIELAEKRTRAWVVKVGLKNTDKVEDFIGWASDELTGSIGGRQLNLLSKKDVRISGEHNLLNAAAAAAVGAALGIDEAAIRRGINSFRGMPMRLENIGAYGGVTYINDSASTNPQTAAAAIRSMDRPTIALMGGRNKGLDYSRFAHEIGNMKHLRTIIAYGEIGEALAQLVSKQGEVKVERKANMEEALELAISISRSGDVVLLTPGAASFDAFANYQERGQAFNKTVYDHYHRKT